MEIEGAGTPVPLTSLVLPWAFLQGRKAPVEALPAAAPGSSVLTSHRKGSAAQHPYGPPEPPLTLSLPTPAAGLAIADGHK